MSPLPGTAASAAANPTLNACRRRRLGRRAAAAAERERPLRRDALVSIPIDDFHVVSLDEIRAIRADSDCRRHASQPNIQLVIPALILVALTQVIAQPGPVPGTQAPRDARPAPAGTGIIRGRVVADDG